jgi:3-deoxy-D-manno-octulosonic acid kinase
MMAQTLPGYRRIHLTGVDGVVWEPLVQPLVPALAYGTIYDYAARRKDRREFQGRGPAYAISIHDVNVVVRHVRHGGFFAPITRDIFLGSTRAPYEFDVSTRLRAGGVATPRVLAYLRYHVAPGLRRADVVTEEIPDAADLLTVLKTLPPDSDGRPVRIAVGVLINDLLQLGAEHEDLNVRNILIARPKEPRPLAYVLDVDRVRWRPPRAPEVALANWNRLSRSAAKHGLPMRVVAALGAT